MRCEDVELELLEPPISSEVQRHLDECPSCQAFARELGQVSDAAALAPLGTADRAALSTVADGVWSAWHRSPSRRSSWFGYAAAAGVGALVAATGFWVVRPVREVVIERPSPIAQVMENDDPNLSSDDVFFEVTWPDLSDGDGENP